MKQTLSNALNEAVDANILTRDQSETLGTFLQDRGIGSTAGHHQPIEESADTQESPVVDSEAPRFMRGFHDILITIGIIAALVGLWTTLNVWAVLGTTWFLAEIFVKRQRLALPAFTLTFAFVIAVTSLFFSIYYGYLTGADRDFITFRDLELGALMFSVLQFYVYWFLSVLGCLAVFYWRFRVPVSLALIILAIAGFAFTATLWAMSSVSPDPDFYNSHPLLIMLIALTYSVGVLAVAVRFDLSDRTRVTRRSDVAFWVHMGAAPMLLVSSIILVYAVLDEWGPVDFKGNYPSIAIPVVFVLMLIGIVIDRRAFVTAGLISLAVAVGVLVDRYGWRFEDYYGLTLLFVGLIVLCLGSNWQRVRKIIVGRLPDNLQQKLPPLA